MKQIFKMKSRQNVRTRQRMTDQIRRKGYTVLQDMDLNITFKGQSTCFEIVFSLSPFAAFFFFIPTCSQNKRKIKTQPQTYYWLFMHWLGFLKLWREKPSRSEHSALLVSTLRMSGREPLIILYPGPLPYISVVKGRKSVAQSGDLPGTKTRTKDDITFCFRFFFLCLRMLDNVCVY